MIQSIGYTDDGLVYLQFSVALNNEPTTGTMLMSPEDAKVVGNRLKDASELAEKVHVRDSTNTH